LVLDESGPVVINPGYTEITRAFRDVLRARSAITLYGEKLDLRTFGGLKDNEKLRANIKDKYADTAIGALLSVGTSALEFALKLRSEVWPELPLVFAAADEDSVEKMVRLPGVPNATGRTMRFSLAKGIEAARALSSDLNEIVLIGDPLERQPFRRHLLDNLREIAAGLKVRDLMGRSLREVETQVASLPETSVVIYTAMTEDGRGTNLVPYEVTETLSKVSSRPIVVDVDNRFGHGGTGGYVARPDRIGSEAAELVLRIFGGEPASTIPVTSSEASAFVFDWRELKRWGVSQAKLPANSIVLFEPPSLWKEYQDRVLLIAMAFVLQSLLIVGLFYEDRRRRLAEAQTHELSNELAHLGRVTTAGELSASIAHEIRQPLAAIVASSAAGLNWLAKAIPNLEEARKALQTITRESYRANDVIRNIRAMFRKEPQPKKSIDVETLIRQVLTLVTRNLYRHEVKLKTEFAEKPLPQVVVDPVQLQQAVLNIIVNAVEAMRGIKDRDRILELTTGIRSHGRVEIMVADSGAGIQADDIRNIFNPFFTTKPDGMGLGLSICKSIIEAHGGELKVSSRENVGTRFHILLPSKSVRHDHEQGSSKQGKDAVPADGFRHR
jgi:signal transduction histidine kinase